MRGFTAAVVLLLVSATAEAQQPPRPAPDFLFGKPSGSIGIRGSWVFARAGSDVFDFVREHLTVDDGAFNAPAIGTDLAITINSRVEAVAGFDYSQVTAPSEYRDFVDNNRQPIEQATRLREANISGTLRVALAPRGIGISRLAWIPRRVTPYVGAGGGMLWYEFAQSGDFIDVLSSNRTVFTDTIRSTGWTPSAHALGGIDLRVQRRTFVTLEGRYLWAAARLQRRFENFDPIDLAGFRLSAGLNVLF